MDRSNLACATIKDSNSDHPIVISACGVGPDGVETTVEKWDLATWDTEVLPFTCPMGNYSHDISSKISPNSVNKHHSKL